MHSHYTHPQHRAEDLHHQSFKKPWPHTSKRHSSIPQSSTSHAYAATRTIDEPVPGPRTQHRGAERSCPYLDYPDELTTSRARTLERTLFRIRTSTSPNIPEVREVRDEPRAGPTLSVFNRPTATYAWPDLDYCLRHGSPLLVDYSLRHSSPSSQESDYQYGESSSSVDTGRPIAYDHNLDGVTNDVRRMGLTSLSDTSIPRREPNCKESELQRLRAPLASRDRARGSHEVALPGGPSPQESNHSESRWHLASETGWENRPRPAPQPIREPDWESYSQKVRDLDGTLLFRCIWELEPNKSCDYVAKKQLVKRHVLATHLGHKPYQCTFPGCDKAFSQRTSRDTHAFGHTRQRPHKCPYPECDQAFSDPARRHKHMVDAHDYTPGRRVVKAYNIVSEPSSSTGPFVREIIGQRRQRRE